MKYKIKKSIFKIAGALALAVLVAGSLRYFNKQNVSKPPRTGGVVSMLPSNTEILFALGVDDISGVSSFCNWPPEAQNIQKLGDSFAPDIEGIIKLKPRVVFLGEDNSFDLAPRIRRYGLNVVVVPNAKRVEDIYSNIELIAKNTGKDASQVIAELKEIVGVKPPLTKRVYIEVDSGYFTAGGQSFISDFFEYHGAKNIFKNIKEEYFQTSLEAILERRPDVVYKMLPLNYKDDGEVLPTGKEVFVFDPDIYARPSVRALQNIRTPGRKIKTAAK
ncbi:MAG: helical backbone metal receptor [Elusimicrobiota bacterium]|jgi:iron complex transport system substrate-binding protein|nr:helical backbone metal receptor [Elusimicrobiota bacterium]